MTSYIYVKEQGVRYQAAWRMYRDGKLPVPAEQRPTGTIIVKHPKAEPTGVAIYARVSSSDQRSDLDGQVARVVECVTNWSRRCASASSWPRRRVRPVTVFSRFYGQRDPGLGMGCDAWSAVPAGPWRTRLCGSASRGQLAGWPPAAMGRLAQPPLIRQGCASRRAPPCTARSSPPPIGGPLRRATHAHHLLFERLWGTVAEG